MLIVYCNKCGARVPPTDLTAGRALETAANVWLCVTCARPEQKIASSGLATVSAMPKTTRGRTAFIPRVAVPAPQKRKSNSALILAGLGAAAGGLLLILAIFLHYKTVPGKETRVAGSRDALDAAKPAPLQPPLAGTKKIETLPLNPLPSTAATSPAPVLTPAPVPPPTPANATLTRAELASLADKEMENMRSQRASRLLQEQQERFKQDPSDAVQYRSKLLEIATSYRSTDAGVEARRILETLKIPAISGRFIRIENTGKGKVLSLAEVQVICGGINVAPNGKASQSSVENDGAPQRAIDGNTDGNWFVNSTTHTRNEDNPWWELDLGDEKNLEELLIWNRTDCCSERLRDFQVSILNKDRVVVWHTTVPDIPTPKVVFPLAPK